MLVRRCSIRQTARLDHRAGRSRSVTQVPGCRASSGWRIGVTKKQREQQQPVRNNARTIRESAKWAGVDWTTPAVQSMGEPSTGGEEDGRVEVVVEELAVQRVVRSAVDPRIKLARRWCCSERTPNHG